MIKFFLKRRERKNLFYAILGYRKLLKEKKLKDIRLLINNLHHTEINSIYFKPFFLYETNKNNISNEIILRQYLISFLVRKLYFTYLTKIGGKKNVTYTAPSEWLNQIEHKQDKKLQIFNKINFYIFAFNRIFKSIFLFNSILKANITNKKSVNKLNKNTAYFFDLSEGCLPNNLNENKDNIINWYINWEKKLKNLKIIASNLKPNSTNQISGLSFTEDGDPRKFIGSKYNLIKFIIFYICDLLLSIIYLFIGNLGNSIMLPELTLSRSLSFLGSNNIAGHYLFKYTFSIYRPLWTYIAEKKGSRISLYFYSTNAQLASPFGVLSESHAYYPLSWPEYMVWTILLKKVIKENSVNNPKIYVVKYILFQALKYNKIKIPKKSIVIFDVEPQRLIKYIKENGFSSHSEYIYYNKLLNKKFFNDIITIASKNKFTVFHKRKRVLGDEENLFYKKMIQDLEKEHCFNSVDPNYNPVDLIKNSHATISLPFTSVSYIAKKINKPSIYYDPENYILKNDKNSNGVTIINGIENLSKWFQSI